MKSPDKSVRRFERIEESTKSYSFWFDKSVDMSVLYLLILLLKKQTVKVFSSKKHLFFYLILLFTNFQLSAVEIPSKPARDNYFRPVNSDGELVEESYFLQRKILSL